MRRGFDRELTEVYLDEANFLSVAAEALPTAHQSILPDQTMRVSAYPAADKTKLKVENEC